MPQGKVKWFNNAKGYGFIIADEGNGDLCNEDLFAHFSAIQMEGYKTLKAGQSVLFDAQPSGKGFHAVNIRACDMDSEVATQPLDQPAGEHPEGQPDTAATGASGSQKAIQESGPESNQAYANL